MASCSAAAGVQEDDEHDEERLRVRKDTYAWQVIIYIYAYMRAHMTRHDGTGAPVRTCASNYNIFAKFRYSAMYVYALCSYSYI